MGEGHNVWETTAARPSTSVVSHARVLASLAGPRMGNRATGNLAFANQTTFNSPRMVNSEFVHNRFRGFGSNRFGIFGVNRFRSHPFGVGGFGCFGCGFGIRFGFGGWGWNPWWWGPNLAYWNPFWINPWYDPWWGLGLYGDYGYP